MNPKKLPKRVRVNGMVYPVLRLLGKGKGGYSYLVQDGDDLAVLKQIHHEPCSYYQFGDKIKAEMDAYECLSKLGIPMPELLELDPQNERIVKEYIDGPTIYELVKEGKMKEEYIEQVRKMCETLYPAGINIDYFPTNFVVRDGILYYVDYECNSYMDEWNFENWGIQYWSQTPAFLEHVKNTEQNG